LRKETMSLPELETKCWGCWGEGVISSENHGGMVECGQCSGVGWIPTEDGKRLLEFLQRHLVIDFDEADV
jgi:hypothetical protein